MRKILIICTCSLFSCTLKEKEVSIRSESKLKDFRIEAIDTLKANSINTRNFKYVNKEFDSYEKRFIEVFYIINDSMFNGELQEIEKYDFGYTTNAKKSDTLAIHPFKHKGNKILTFVIYDEVQIPVSKDSTNVKYVISKYTYKTYVQ